MLQKQLQKCKLRNVNLPYEEKYYWQKKISTDFCLWIIPLTDNSSAARKLLRWRLMLLGWGAVADWYHCYHCSLSPSDRESCSGPGFRLPITASWYLPSISGTTFLRTADPQRNNNNNTIQHQQQLLSAESSAVQCLVTACPVLVTCSFCCRFMFLQLDNGQHGHGGFWHLMEIAKLHSRRSRRSDKHRRSNG